MEGFGDGEGLRGVEVGRREPTFESSAPGDGMGVAGQRVDDLCKSP